MATEPVARIPQLAIHLDCGANKALSLDPQQHTQPIWGCGDEPGDVLALLAEAASRGGLRVRAEDLLGWDIVLADTQQPRLSARTRSCWPRGGSTTSPPCTRVSRR